jgi:hypothetical protein
MEHRLGKQVRILAVAALAMAACAPSLPHPINTHVEATQACLAEITPPRREIMRFSGREFPDFAPTAVADSGQSVAYGYIREAYDSTALTGVAVWLDLGDDLWFTGESDRFGRYETVYPMGRAKSVVFIEPGYAIERLPLSTTPGATRIDAELVFDERCPIVAAPSNRELLLRGLPGRKVSDLL